MAQKLKLSSTPRGKRKVFRSVTGYQSPQTTTLEVAIRSGHSNRSINRKDIESGRKKQKSRVPAIFMRHTI